MHRIDGIVCLTQPAPSYSCLLRLVRIYLVEGSQGVRVSFCLRRVIPLTRDWLGTIDARRVARRTSRPCRTFEVEHGCLSIICIEIKHRIVSECAHVSINKSSLLPNREDADWVPRKPLLGLLQGPRYHIQGSEGPRHPRALEFTKSRWDSVSYNIVPGVRVRMRAVIINLEPAHLRVEAYIDRASARPALVPRGDRISGWVVLRSMKLVVNRQRIVTERVWVNGCCGGVRGRAACKLIGSDSTSSERLARYTADKDTSVIGARVMGGKGKNLWFTTGLRTCFA